MADEKIEGVPSGLTEEPLVKTTGIQGVPSGLTEEALPAAAHTDSAAPENKGLLDTAKDFWSKKADSVDKAVTSTLAPDTSAGFLKTQAVEVPKTLGREIYSMGKTALGMPAGIYHALADPATEEEKSKYADFEQKNKELPGSETSGVKRIGLAANRMLGLDSAADAMKSYTNPATHPTYEQALSVAPEAMGQGAGTVVGAEALGKGAKGINAENLPTVNAAKNTAMRTVGKGLGKVLDNPEIAGTIVGAATGHGFGSIYVGSKVGRMLEKLGVDSSAVDPLRYAGMEQDEINLNKLEKAAKVADKAKEKADADRAVYAASEVQGPLDPEAHPALKKTTEAQEKAAAAQAEAHFHLNEAKEAVRTKATNSKASAEPDQPLGLSPEQEAVQAARTPKAPAAPTTPQNVKLPGQVQPETFPQTPTEAPRVTMGKAELPGGQGTMGRTRMLGEGTPEAPVAPAVAEAPKPVLGEILPPERPAKPGRLGTLRVNEGGRVVDTEPELQQRIEEGLQGSSKPKAVAPKKFEEILPKHEGEEAPEYTELTGHRLGVPEPIKEDIGAKVRGDAPPLPRGERRGIPRTAEEQAATKRFSQARKELPEDATWEEVQAKADEIKTRSAEGAPKSEAKETEYTPEHESKVEQVLSQHTDQDLIRQAKKAGIDADKYDFAKRNENRHRVERDQLVKDLLSKMPEKDKANVARLSDDFDNKDSSTWTEAERNALSKAQRARAIMQEHEGGPKTIAGGAPDHDWRAGHEPEDQPEGHDWREGHEASPKVVGTAEGAKQDTDFMAQAKKSKPDATLSEQLQEAQRLKDAAAKKPVDVAKAADDYNKENKLHPIQPEKIADRDKRAADIADAFDKMEHNPNDPAVKASYDALKSDIKKQWDYATKKLGIKLEGSDEDPYKSYEDMEKDVKDNKTLKSFRGGNELKEGHPLYEVDPETGENYNTMFRAIHDLFGHVAQGHDFSEPGEESAWHAHMQMMEPAARPAMTTETRGQTSWFFNREPVRLGEEAAGKFADQKAGLLPDFAMERDAIKPKQVFSHIKGDERPFAILTAENPSNERLTDAENAKRNHELMIDLRDQGYKPKAVGGVNKDVEGKTEHAFFVPDITAEEAAKLGNKHGQESVLTKDGLHHIDSDKINPSDNKGLITGDKAKEEPYYSVVDGEPFAVPVDFNKEIPAGKAKAYKDMTPEEKETLAAKGQSGASGKMFTGEELLKKYGKSEGDPAHTAFILPDGRGVDLPAGAVHDEMLGGKTNDKVPPREAFINQGNIRIRPRFGGKAGREFSISIPEKGVTQEQLEHLNKMAPQMGSGQVTVEVGKPGGDYRQIEYGKASEQLDKVIKELVPVINPEEFTMGKNRKKPALGRIK